MVDRIWAPWRGEYITSLAGAESAFGASGEGQGAESMPPHVAVGDGGGSGRNGCSPTAVETGTDRDIVSDDPSCVFCRLFASPIESASDRRNLLLHRGREVTVVMNKFPYNNGHLLVMPTGHFGHFRGLDRDIFAALHRTLAWAVEALESVLEPHGVNVGMNLGRAAGAGIPDHMHYHLVPRWQGDTNFMPVIGETKVISQHILATYDLLKGHFEKGLD